MPVIVLIVAGVLIAGYAALSATGGLDDVLAALNGRGGRVGPVTHVDGNGVIPDDPLSLATAAGYSLPTYALARMISSEEGNSPRAYKLAVAAAAWNKFGMGIADGLLAGKGDAAGKFKQQGYRYGGGSSAGAYASTAQDPRQDDIAIAQAVVTGTVPDPTGGATNWFRPQLQDKQFAAGTVSKSADDVVASWTGGGLAVVDGVTDVDPSEILFFKKVA